MKSVEIHGRSYIEVNERLKHFRANYPEFKLTSEIVSLVDGVVVMKACVVDKDGVVVATGHAYEKENSTYINKTSYIENCETSAWGRALGNFGIGIDTAVASAEEVQNAISNQGGNGYINEKQLSQIVDMIASVEANEKLFLEYMKADSLENIPANDFGKAMNALNQKARKSAEVEK